MKTFNSLPEIREEIDRIDNELLELLTARAQCSLQVAELKKAADGDDVTFYRPEREAQILRRMASQNQGPLSDDTVRRFYREIISSSLALEEPMSVAYLGPVGTFTHAAAIKHFGSAVTLLPFDAIDRIFRSVETGEARFGVVPVENSTEGMINHTLDMLITSSLIISGESRLRIEHNLLGTLEDYRQAKSVHAHPQSLAQCRQWLATNLPNAELVNASSNAAAAERVGDLDNAVAIASVAAADWYSLNVLKANIEDVTNNTTRFFVVGNQAVPPSGNDSTSLLISASHQPGGLRRMLSPFEDAGVSLTRIESRPSKNNLWEYYFLIDVDGHKDDEVLAPILEKLANETHLMRVLGSYPSAL